MRGIALRFVAFLLRAQERMAPVLNRPAVRVAAVVFFLAAGVLIYAHPLLAQAAKAETTKSPGIIDHLFLIIGMISLGFAMVLGKLVVYLVEVVTIPIMQYNGFATSPVVSAGWSLVRDTVNMFFVIVLIVIAVGTIFGVTSRFEWRQQVPRLLIFAIVINFSKTICGILIDFGQVVMLTFANALVDVAGGNFIQVFGLNDLMQISANTTAMQSIQAGFVTDAPKAFDWMAAGVMSMLMMVIVAATMIMLTTILVYRIVMLWILIVISPLAWFMGGAKDVFSSDAYGEWWKNFKCYVAIGPVLTFFVWLTLAVAGAGNIAATEGFTSSSAVIGSGLSDSNANVGGNLLKIFEVSRFASYIIGIAMIFAGFDAAQKVCAGAKSASFINPVMERFSPSRVASQFKGTAALAAAKAGRGMKSGASTVSTYGARSVQGTGLDVLTQQGRAKRARAMASTTSSPFLATQLGRYAESVDKARAQEVTEAGKAGKEDSTETRVNRMRARAKSGKALTEGQRNADLADYMAVISDKKARASLDVDGSLEKLTGMLGHDAHEASRGDHGMHETLEKYEKSRPDLTGKVGSIVSMDEVKDLDNRTLANDDVKAQLKKVDSNYRDYSDPTGKRYLTAYEAIEEGRMGLDKKNALAGGLGGYYKGLKATDLARVPIDEKFVQNISPELLDKDKTMAARIVSSGDQKVWTALKANKPMHERVMREGAGLNIQTGKIENADRMRATVAANPMQLLSSIRPETLQTAGGQTTEAGRYLAQALDASTLRNVVSKYKATPRTDRSQYAPVMQNVVAVLEEAKKSVPLPEQATQFQTRSDNFKAAIRGVDNASKAQVPTAIAARTARSNRLDEELTKIQTKITEAEKSLNDGSVQVGSLERARARLQRLKAREIEVNNRKGQMLAEVMKLNSISRRGPTV